MALTKDYRETVVARARRDPEFRAGLLQNAVEALQSNEHDVAKEMLRNYIKATVGYKPLAAKTGQPEKSIVRMFGPNGNPTMQNLFSVLSPMLAHEGLKLTTARVPQTRSTSRRQAVA